MIAPDPWLPAGWQIERTTDSAGNERKMVRRPGQTALMTVEEAVILRDLLTTSSRPENRRPAR